MALRATHQSLINPHPRCGRKAPRAVHGLAVTPHLKAPIRHGALDLQPRRLNLERLQEEDTLESARSLQSNCRAARQLQVACSRKDHATLNNVIADQAMYRTTNR